MKKVLLALSFGLTAMNGLVQANTIQAPACVGQSPYPEYQCAGNVDTLSEQPDVLLAFLSTPIYYPVVGPDGQLSGRGLAGNLVSAAYRSAPAVDGQIANVTFFYQFQSVANSPYASNSFGIQPQAPAISYYQTATIGQRQSAAGLAGFVDSSSSFSAIRMNIDSSFLTYFSNAVVNPGQSSAIFEEQSQFGYYASTGSISLTSTPQTGTGSYLTGAYGVLIPAPVPEPSTYGFLLGGLLLIGFAVRHKKFCAQ